MNFFKKLWNKLFPPRREAQHLTYDTTTDDEGNLTPAGKTARKRILTTELKEGDTYRLGPEALVTVGPAGLKGKAWVLARVKASEERRKAKFDAWWAEKRAKCMKIMMMTEAELRESGVYAEVQKFLEENRKMLAQAMEQKLLPERATKAETFSAPVPPSGVHADRVAFSFEEILRGSKVEALKGAGLLVDGKLPDATPETIEKYALVSAEMGWRPGSDE